jgi:integrase
MVVQRLNNVQQATIRPLIERFSDFRWHDLRHTWASWHVQAGTPLNVLKNVRRHIECVIEEEAGSAGKTQNQASINEIGESCSGR